MTAFRQHPVDLACNDAQGRFAGVVRGVALSVGDELIELEPVRDGGWIAKMTGDGLLLHGAIFAFSSFQSMYGSVAWNRYWFAWPVFLDLIDAMWDSKLWTCTQGPEDFFDAFNREAFV